MRNYAWEVTGPTLIPHVDSDARSHVVPDVRTPRTLPREQIAEIQRPRTPQALVLVFKTTVYNSVNCKARSRAQAHKVLSTKTRLLIPTFSAA